jgi:signal transduction histidine kinase
MLLTSSPTVRSRVLVSLSLLVGLGVALLSKTQTGLSISTGGQVLSGGLATALCLAALRWPQPTFFAAAVLFVGMLVWLPAAYPMVYALILVTYFAAAHTQLPLPLIGVVFLAAQVVGQVQIIFWDNPDSPTAVNLLAEAVVDGLIVTALVVVLGQQTRLARAANAELQQLRVVERDHAVAEERQRIAVELHDIAAHHLSAVAVRAKVALRTGTPDDLRSATQMAATTASESLDALQQLVHVLSESGAAPLAPQSGLAQLDDIVDRVRAAGVDVTLDTPRPLPQLDPQVDLASVRIVQESLTNVLRHRGPGPAHVRLDVTGEELHIDVRSQSHDAQTRRRRRSATSSPSTGGRGVIGMHERARACGGTLSAGPQPGGVWLVSARLPVRGARA